MPVRVIFLWRSSDAIRTLGWQILAFELHQPFRLLQVVQEIMALNEIEMLDDIVGKMKPEQVRPRPYTLNTQLDTLNPQP